MRTFRIKRVPPWVSEDVQEGDMVQEFTDHDYGLASDDTRATGVEHISVVPCAEPNGPSFTVPLSDLEEIK